MFFFFATALALAHDAAAALFRYYLGYYRHNPYK
jgi:hypothetical protein